MKQHRKWLSCLLGAVLLLQGMAVSAAPRASLGESHQTAMVMKADIPCDGQTADQTGQIDQIDKGDRSCCDAGCPDMTSCALGHLALTTPFQLETSVAPTERSRLTPARILSRTPRSLLRPPISLHA